MGMPDQSEELAGLVQPPPPVAEALTSQRDVVQLSPDVPVTKKWRRRTAVGAAIVIGVSGAILAKRSLTPCVPAVAVNDVIQEAAAAIAKDPTHAEMRRLTQDRTTVLTWLAAANGAADGAEKGSKGKMTRTALAEAADEAIKKALATRDPAEVPKMTKKLVEKAMSKAIIRNKDKRTSLLKYLREAEAKKKHGGHLFGADPEPEDTKSSSNPVVSVLGDVAKALYTPTTKSPSEMEAEAYCTFDVLQLVTTMALFGSSLNDVIKTCEDVSVQDLLMSEADQTHAKVCSVNLAAMAAAMASMATTSALLADDCAATMIPNIDALCSAAVTATLTASAAFAGAFTLINAACRSKGWYAKIPEGVTPSNVGSNERMEALRGSPGGFRRLEDVASEDMAGGFTPAAPPRKLLFGGGKASLATQCGTEIANIAWSIAGFGLDIYNAAGSPSKGIDGNCPPRNLLTGKQYPKGLLYKASVGLCNMDVSSAMLNIFSIMIFAQLIAVTCTDELNLGAICGSGVVGVLAGAVGISKAGTALWFACDVGQVPLIRHLVGIIRQIDIMSGEALTKLIRGGNLDLSTLLTDLNLGGGDDSFGRRLEEINEWMETDTVKELKAKYDSPADVWKDLGFDLEDPNAPWRKLHKDGQQLRDGDLANFVEEDETHPIFGQPQTCSAK